MAISKDSLLKQGLQKYYAQAYSTYNYGFTNPRGVFGACDIDAPIQDPSATVDQHTLELLFIAAFGSNGKIDKSTLADSVSHHDFSPTGIVVLITDKATDREFWRWAVKRLHFRLEFYAYKDEYLWTLLPTKR